MSNDYFGRREFFEKGSIFQISKQFQICDFGENLTKIFKNSLKNYIFWNNRNEKKNNKNTNFNDYILNINNNKIIDFININNKEKSNFKYEKKNDKINANT